MKSFLLAVLALVAFAAAPTDQPEAQSFVCFDGGGMHACSQESTPLDCDVWTANHEHYAYGPAGNHGAFWKDCDTGQQQALEFAGIGAPVAPFPSVGTKRGTFTFEGLNAEGRGLWANAAGQYLAGPCVNSRNWDHYCPSGTPPFAPCDYYAMSGHPSYWGFKEHHDGYACPY